MPALQLIPRRVIQTGKSAHLPVKERAVVASLRLLNPDFEYMFFDDSQVEDFIDTNFPAYRAVFDAFPFRIQKYDFFRYLAVYRYGGFYFDLDVFLAASLAPLLEHAAVFPFEGLNVNAYLRGRQRMDWHIGNYAFGAREGDPFLGAVIENCVRAQADAAWVAPIMKGVLPLSRDEFYVLNTTGPGLLSRTLAEQPALAAHVHVLFPPDVCDPSGWNHFGDYGVHLMNGTWRADRGFLRRRIAQRFETYRFNRLMRQSQALGPRRAMPAVDVAAAAGDAEQPQR
jgi:inositol phosphorylceramide mannosyltransferase catalytic subunit